MILKRLFQVFVFLLPSQLSVHFWPQYAFVWGVRVDFLAPVLFLTDILFFILFAIWFVRSKRKALNLKNYALPLLTLFIYSLINIYNSEVWQVSLFGWLKVFELFLLFVFIRENRWTTKALPAPLFLSLLLVLFLSFLQIAKGGSVGGAFYFLGERSFSVSTPGISLFSVSEKEFLRPYATFGHPNTLSGFALLCFFLFLRSGKNIAAFVTVLLILISWSQNAWFALIGVPTALYLTRKTSVSFAKTFFAFTVSSLIFAPISRYFLSAELPLYLSRRVELNALAGQFFSQNFLFGSGLSTFASLLPRFREPVHNIFLLVATETGIVGLLLFVLLILKVTNKYNMVFVLAAAFVGLFDHYFLTQQQTMLLLAIVMAAKPGRISS